MPDREVRDLQKDADSKLLKLFNRKRLRHLGTTLATRHEKSVEKEKGGFKMAFADMIQKQQSITYTENGALA